MSKKKKTMKKFLFSNDVRRDPFVKFILINFRLCSANESKKKKNSGVKIFILQDKKSLCYFAKDSSHFARNLNLFS